MKELEYPFDGDYILAKKKSIKKELLANGNFVEKRIAILGGSTTNNIKLLTELFLLNNGIKPEFYESEYNQYYQDALFPNEELLNFNPDVIYVCTSNRNIIEYPNIHNSLEEVNALYEKEKEKFTSIWKSLKEKFNCPIIQNNFELPFYRLMGNRDCFDYHGAVNFISRLNSYFYEYAQQNENFYICDINYISADFGLNQWSDPFYWHMYKYAMNLSAMPLLAHNIANIIKSIFGKNKKGLVLDLDNTLWGGVIGDDGVENILIGPEESEGQVYTEFQTYLKKLKDYGILLNIDSKNDYENAIKGLNHPDTVLTKDDFISIKANWDPKDKNFKEIATELNLLPESLVFIDDNPAERHIVREQVPGVCVPELDAVHHYVQVIDHSGFFEITSLSKDDLKRNEMYKENALRAQASANFSDYGEYLDSLEMKAIIKPFEPIYMQRIAQLSNKSNQFNLTTKRYTQEEIEACAADSNKITLYGKLLDKFGDNGVVSVVIGNIINDECHVELWLMSCRVLKRGMEDAMMDTLVHCATVRNLKKIIGYYYPTAKNAMVKSFYENMGFSKIAEDSAGNTTWQFDISNDYVNKNSHIKIEE